jgi:hypothetical protein
MARSRPRRQAGDWGLAAWPVLRLRTTRRAAPDASACELTVVTSQMSGEFALRTD